MIIKNSWKKTCFSLSWGKKFGTFMFIPANHWMMFYLFAAAVLHFNRAKNINDTMRKDRKWTNVVASLINWKGVSAPFLHKSCCMFSDSTQRGERSSMSFVKCLPFILSLAWTTIGKQLHWKSLTKFNVAWQVGNKSKCSLFLKKKFLPCAKNLQTSILFDLNSSKQKYLKPTMESMAFLAEKTRPCIVRCF